MGTTTKQEEFDVAIVGQLCPTACPFLPDYCWSCKDEAPRLIRFLLRTETEVTLLIKTRQTMIVNAQIVTLLDPAFTCKVNYKSTNNPRTYIKIYQWKHEVHIVHSVTPKIKECSKFLSLVWLWKILRTIETGWGNGSINVLPRIKKSWYVVLFRVLDTED